MKLRAPIKLEIVDALRRHLNGKEPEEAKVHLISNWIFGLIENAERLNWVEDGKAANEECEVK